MIKISKSIFSALMVFLITNSVAQTSSISPYSRFGPGELLFKGFAHQRGMGGASLAECYSGRLNFSNPASYAYDSLMVFEFGMSGERIWMTQNTNTNDYYNGKIEYLVLGVPLIKNKMGLAFGFIPYSGVGYSIQGYSVIQPSNLVSTTYEGSGGYNRYFLGTGLKLSKQVSLGVNASYFYGSTAQSRQVEFSDNNYFGTRALELTNIGDFLFEFGLQYRGELKNNYVFSMGANFSMEQNMKANRSYLWENFKKNALGVEFSRDTVAFVEKERGEVILPMTAGFGVQLAKGNKWLVQSDVRFQDWSSYQSFGQKDSLENSMRLSLGGQFSIDPGSLSFFKRMQFRAGIFYNKSFLNLRDNVIEDKGFSFGFGLPLRKSYQSMINIAFETGQRGTIQDNLIREDYFRVILGLTFNENWFQKHRFE